MNSPYKKIKAEARGRLTGHWPSALGVLLLPASAIVLLIYVNGYILSCAGADTLDSIGQILFHPGMLWALAGAVLLDLAVVLLVLRPLLLGVQRWWIGLAYGQDLGAGVCLWYFSKKTYLPCIKYSLRTGLYVLLAAIPSAGLALLLTVLKLRIGQPELYALLENGLDHLTLAQLDTVTAALISSLSTALLVLLVLCLPLFPADFLYITAPQGSSSFRRSLTFMLTHGECVLRFLLSFLWWILLSLLVFPLVYTLPYMGVSAAVLCKWLSMPAAEQQHNA